MVANAEERKFDLLHLNERDGPAFKIENDPRITPLGRFFVRNIASVFDTYLPEHKRSGRATFSQAV